jgi:acylphosphatase
MKKRLESGISARSVGFSELSWVKIHAEELGLKGVIAVQNDGSIKIIAEGPEEDLIIFAQELEKEEHSLSRVENFYINWEKPTGEFQDFSILAEHEELV